MNVVTQGEVPIHTEGDIVVARQKVRELTGQTGFSLTDTTRVVTAASELARNIFHYAGSGVMRWRSIADGERKGIELEFADKGPGIEDINQALQEGYSTGEGLGMG